MSSEGLRYHRRCVDTARLTIAALLMSLLALIALMAAGWRPRARATADPAHSRNPGYEDLTALPVAELDAPIERPTAWWRRLWSVAAGFGLGLWVGAAMATIAGFGAAWLVIRLTDMLRR